MGIARQAAFPAARAAARPVTGYRTRPDWVLADELYVQDWAQGLYWSGGRIVELADVLASSRNSPMVEADADGVLRSALANAPLVSNGGLSAWLSRTNKSTNYNANPPALIAMTDGTSFTAAATNVAAQGGDANSRWGVVDAAAQILAAGLAGVCTAGRAYRINDTAGAAAADLNLLGAAGNTNVHTVSAYILGTGNAKLGTGLAGATFALQFALSSGFVRRAASGTPGSTQGGRVIALAGADVFAILPQYEEGSFASPPIITTGGTATRQAENLTMSGLALAPGRKIRVKAAYNRTPASKCVLSHHRTDANNYIEIYANGTACHARVVRGGAEEANINVAAAIPTNGTPFEAELTLAANGISLAVDGGAPASSGAITMPDVTAMTTHKAGSDAAPANHANTQLKRFSIAA